MVICLPQSGQEIKLKSNESRKEALSPCNSIKGSMSHKTLSDGQLTKGARFRRDNDNKGVYCVGCVVCACVHAWTANWEADVGIKQT